MNQKGKENNECETVQFQSSNYHTPVLYTEVLNALQIKPNGVYVDCTFGGGGHSKGILEKLNHDGKLIAFDQDEDIQQNLIEDKRLIFIHQNFRHISRYLRLHGINKVDGVLADLGVSSHQFDEGKRGFSIRFNGPLNMRMDNRQALTAAKVIAEYSKEKLHQLFEQYGEVTNSKTLATHIVSNRQKIETIDQFKTMISPVVKGNPNKYLAQVFQAIRIEVNDEMGALKEMLEQLPLILKPGGIAAVISFHSIEDRLVKKCFKQGGFESDEENPFSTMQKEKIFNIVTKKPIVASSEELKINVRSRSAKLRVAIKL